ncbi:MFS general substrate transporter, partial [Thozetella sp. PMI_491]
EISELECEDELADKWSWQKKWFVLVVIAIVQTSMNFNTTLYGAGKEGIKQQFGVTEMQAVSGAAIFLITYAFGCELWAPWSEELGRKIVLQLSLFFVNVFCLPVALAPNFASVLVGRALGGLASAGGSVTLGIVADMYDPEDHQYAIAFVSLSSVGGSIFGAIISGFVESNLENPPLDYPLGWRWSIWIQLFFGLFVQFLHLFVPETRKTVLMDRIARQRRKADPQRFGNLYGPSEMKTKRERFLNRDMILATWARPFKMLATEPIVICLSLLSGFADALIFMCVQSFGTVYAQWWGTVKDDAGVLHADPWKIGLTFVPIGLAYLVSWATFLPAIKKNIRDRKRVQEDLEADAKKRAHVNYEGRMWWLLWTAPWLVIGLVIFSATSGGPPTHWMGTMVGSFMIGIANYAIYMATIDYMVAAYGEYSASATGGNGFARDFLAGLLTWSAGPFYQGIGADRKDSFHLQIPTGILSVISLFLVGSIYVIYYRGPMMREKSPFAQSIEHVREVRAASRAASRAPS